MNPQSPAKGDVVAGKYRVEQMVCISGRCRVLEATDLHRGERVALRLPGILNDLSVEAFLDAARRAARRHADRVERVTAVAEAETGGPLIATELLEGIDLETEMRQGGPLGIEDAIDFVIQACEA